MSGACCEKWQEALDQKVGHCHQIEFDKHDGEYVVNGCCGSACQVLTGLEFCPWCGTKLEAPEC